MPKEVAQLPTVTAPNQITTNIEEATESEAIDLSLTKKDEQPKTAPVKKEPEVLLLEPRLTKRRLTCQLNEDQTPSTPKKQKNVMEKMTMRKKNN